MISVDADIPDKPPNQSRVEYWDIILLLLSIIFHFLDIGSDIFVACSYFKSKQYVYFGSTLIILIVTGLVISAVSIKMYRDDKDPTWKALIRPGLCIVGLILQVAPVIRYFDSLKYAQKCRRAELQNKRNLQLGYYKKMLEEESDAALLRVFECYLESAFQLVLQITLLVIDYSCGSQVNTKIQWITITTSFLSMGWCMVNYHKKIRFERDDKPNISKLGIGVQFLWHVHFTVSRILAVAAVAILYPVWAAVAVASHWFAMMMWIFVTYKAHFCDKNQISKLLFSGAMGIIYIFNFVTLNEGPTKISYSIFFCICGLENIIASVLWYTKAQLFFTGWIYYFFLILPISAFMLGVFFCLIYYSLLHPNKYQQNS